MKTSIEQSAFIKEASSQETNNGYLSIRASEAINIDEIIGTVFLEARGKMSGQRKEIVSFVIANQKRIPTKDLTDIPFSFKLPTNSIDSYSGKNVSFSYNCEVSTYINREDIGRVDKSLFKTIKSFLTSDDSLKVSRSFQVSSSANDYQIIELTNLFSLKFNFILLLIVAFLFGGMYLFYIPEYTPAYIIPGVLIVALMQFLTTRYIENILGDVTMQTVRTENGFLCKLKKTGNFNLTNQKMYYEIIEKVVDNRGTSSSTYKEVIYKSEVKPVPEFKDSSNLTFYYPEREGLFSTKVGDASIIWTMNLQGATRFGISLTYYCEFTVGKKEG